MVLHETIALMAVRTSSPTGPGHSANRVSELTQITRALRTLIDHDRGPSQPRTIRPLDRVRGQAVVRGNDRHR